MITQLCVKMFFFVQLPSNHKRLLTTIKRSKTGTESYIHLYMEHIKYWPVLADNKYETETYINVRMENVTDVVIE